MVDITFVYQRKSYKVNVEIPLTYDKLVSAVSHHIGLAPEEQQLLVKDVQITEESDLSKMRLYKFHVTVCKLSPLTIHAGSVCFPYQFCLSFTGSLLCNYVLEILRSGGFNLPQLDYCLMINNSRIDMSKKLEDVGCESHSDVTLVSKTGEDLNEFIPPENDEDLPAEVENDEDLPAEVENEENLPAEAENEDDLPAEPKKESTPTDAKEDKTLSMEAEKEGTLPAKSEEQPNDSLVTIQRRVKPSGKSADREDSSKCMTDSSHHVSVEQDLPESVKSVLSAAKASLTSEEGQSLYHQIECIVREYQSRLFAVSSRCRHTEEVMDTIHYENQMLREMYNEAVPSEEDRAAVEKAKKCSFTRPPITSSYVAEELELPDDVEALKKLVNEKYATALMNERRFLKEKKRSQKYQLVARTLGVTEENVNDYYSQINEVSLQRDQLKEENLDLKEKMRALNAELDARDDELRRLTVTVQNRDEELKELAERIERYDELLREKTEVEGGVKGEEVGKVKTEMERVLKEKEEELERVKEESERVMKEKEEELERVKEELERVKEEKDDEVEKVKEEMDRALKEKEAELERVREDEVEKVKEGLERVLKEKEEEIERVKEEKDRVLKEKEEVEKQSDLREQNRNDSGESEEVAQLKEALMKMAESKRKKKEVIAQIQMEMDEVKEVIVNQGYEIEEKDRLIGELKRELEKEKENGMEKKDEEMQLLKEENTKLREQVKKVVEENEKNAESDRDLVSSLESTLALLQSRMKSKEDYVKALQATCALRK